MMTLCSVALSGALRRGRRGEPAEPLSRRLGSFHGARMISDTAETLIARIRSIESEVDALQKIISAEALPENHRRYLARCFDLLHMELAAVRVYIATCGDV